MKYYEYVDTPPEHQREQKKQCLYQFGVSLHCICLCFCIYQNPEIPCLRDSMSCQDDQTSTTRPCQIKESQTLGPRCGVNWNGSNGLVGVQWFMNLWYDSLDSLTILKSYIMLPDCEWEDCDSHDRNKSLSKQNQSNTLLEVGHSGGKGIPLDLDGRKPCPETYGNIRNNLKHAILKIPSLEEWPIGTGSSTSFTSVATTCGPFRDSYVLQVKGHGKKTANWGHSRASISYQRQGTRSTPKSWGMMKDAILARHGCFVQSIMVFLYEATSKSITIVKPSIKFEELSVVWGVQVWNFLSVSSLFGTHHFIQGFFCLSCMSPSRSQITRTNGRCHKIGWKPSIHVIKIIMWSQHQYFTTWNRTEFRVYANCKVYAFWVNYSNKLGVSAQKNLAWYFKIKQSSQANI